MSDQDPGGYFCGICGKEHTTDAAADQCHKRCLTKRQQEAEEQTQPTFVDIMRHLDLHDA